MLKLETCKQKKMFKLDIVRKLIRVFIEFAPRFNNKKNNQKQIVYITDLSLASTIKRFT